MHAERCPSRPEVPEPSALPAGVGQGRRPAAVGEAVIVVRLVRDEATRLVREWHRHHKRSAPSH